MKRIIFSIVFSLLSLILYSRPIFTIGKNKVTVEIELIGKKASSIHVEVLTPSAVRISSFNKEGISPSLGLVVKEELPDVRFKANYKDKNVEITTSDIIVEIEENGLVRVFNRASSKLVIESDKMFTDSDQQAGAFTIKQRLFLNSNEQLFGLGQSNNNRKFNIRGSRVDILQDQVATATPIFYSDKGYAVIWDNYSASSFIDTKGYLELNAAVAEGIQFICIHGPGWDKIISELRTISGKAPMLPRWAYGFWHSPTSIDASNNQESVTSKYRLLNIPIEPFPGDFSEWCDQEKSLTSNAENPKFANALALQLYKEKIGLIEQSEKRVCIPSRSAFPGIHQFGTYTFAGSVPGCWTTLQNQVIAGINFTLAGQPYWSTNIGGINENNCNKEPYAEMLTRWYQFAAFNPVFQVSEKNREPWSVSKPGETYFEAISNAIKLRYRLLPYIYTVASQVYLKDGSLVRPLFAEFPTDPSASKTDRQFMFGPSILVCPVLEPGIQTMKIYLPGKDIEWFDFWTGKKYQGGVEVDINVDISRIPLFVKGGSLIPLGDSSSAANDSTVQTLELRVYPSLKIDFQYYEDQFDGQGYRNNLSAVFPMVYIDKEKTLEIDSPKGSFPGLITQRKFHAVLVGEDKGIGINPSENFKVIDYKGKRTKTKLE